VLGPDSIVTVSGRGYQFVLPQDADAGSERAPDTVGTRGEDGAGTGRMSASHTALIGRDSLIAKSCALLRRDNVRLVTLSGPGGSGKTRVGLRVTAELAHHFADGSYVIMLAAVRDDANVAASVASAIGVQESGSRPIDELLVGWLRNRCVLLTLDNFEHVMAATTLLTLLLERCPNLKILVTSRTLLKLSEEHEVFVPPLPLPALRASRLQALESPAVQLLINRAERVGHPIGERPAEIDAAVAICRRLDGLPLAIELAAARLNVLSPDALAERLGSRLKLLRSSASDLPSRQKTLHDAITWSYDLLSADERTLFRRLAVFVGGWTLNAAEAIAGDERLSTSVLDLLSSLIDHSLVQRTEDVGGEPRFAMLETVREYSEGLLEKSSEVTDLRMRHAEYFTVFAEAVEPRLRTGDRAAWIPRMTAEYNNLRAALSWVVLERPDATIALRLAGALPWYWYFAGQFSEGRGWIGLALGMSVADNDAARAKLLAGAARLALYSGAIDQANELARASVALFRVVGDYKGLALALVPQGISSLLARDFAGACASLEEATLRFREVGDEWGIALATTYHGTVLALEPGRESEARLLLVEGRARFRALGDEWGVTTSSHYLGTLAMRESDFAAAREFTEEMLASARELGDTYRVSRNLHQLAEIALAENRVTEAAHHLRHSLALNHEHGRAGDAAQQLRLLARIESLQQRPERVVRLYAAASRPERKESTMPPDDPRVHDTVLAETRRMIGSRRFEAEWALGTAMSLDQAVTWALATEGGITAVQ
jgi:predicted ATPase